MQSADTSLGESESTGSPNPIREAPEQTRKSANLAARARRESHHDAELKPDMASSIDGLGLQQGDYMMADAESDDAGAERAASANTDELPVASKVLFSGAGLPYTYKFEAFYLRFGLDESPQTAGSEHRINSRAYPAELQLVAYNSFLYRSFAEAATKPFGLMAVAVLIEVIKGVNQAAQPDQNQALESVLANLDSVKHRGLFVPLRNLSVASLLPEAEHFVTYEGSLTTPACYESVQWVLLNKPLYIKQTQVSIRALVPYHLSPI